MIEEKIEDLKQKIEELNKMKKNFEALPEDRRLAENIHGMLCINNHIDGCAWYYSDWTNPSDTRIMWLEKAQSLLKIISYEDAIKTVKILA